MYLPWRIIYCHGKIRAKYFNIYFIDNYESFRDAAISIIVITLSFSNLISIRNIINFKHDKFQVKF